MRIRLLFLLLAMVFGVASVRAADEPDLSTPNATMRSFLEALKYENPAKARACLIVRGRNLGEMMDTLIASAIESLRYQKAMQQKYGEAGRLVFGTGLVAESIELDLQRLQQCDVDEQGNTATLSLRPDLAQTRSLYESPLRFERHQNRWQLDAKALFHKHLMPNGALTGQMRKGQMAVVTVLQEERKRVEEDQYANAGTAYAILQHRITEAMHSARPAPQDATPDLSDPRAVFESWLEALRQEDIAAAESCWHTPDPVYQRYAHALNVRVVGEHRFTRQALLRFPETTLTQVLWERWSDDKITATLRRVEDSEFRITGDTAELILSADSNMSKIEGRLLRPGHFRRVGTVWKIDTEMEIPPAWRKAGSQLPPEVLKAVTLEEQTGQLYQDLAKEIEQGIYERSRELRVSLFDHLDALQERFRNAPTEAPVKRSP